jgi:hypothetical protein
MNIIDKIISCIAITDKRADVWSQDFIIWKINSGQWAVVWAELWNKRVWADYEQLLRPFLSLFRKHYSVCTEKLLNTFFTKFFFFNFLNPKKWKKQFFFLGLKFEWNLSVNTWRSGTDCCWLYWDQRKIKQNKYIRRINFKLFENFQQWDKGRFGLGPLGYHSGI